MIRRELWHARREVGDALTRAGVAAGQRANSTPTVECPLGADRSATTASRRAEPSASMRGVAALGGDNSISGAAPNIDQYRLIRGEAPW